MVRQGGNSTLYEEKTTKKESWMDKNSLFVRPSIGDFALCANGKGGP